MDFDTSLNQDVLYLTLKQNFLPLDQDFWYTEPQSFNNSYYVFVPSLFQDSISLALAFDSIPYEGAEVAVDLDFSLADTTYEVDFCYNIFTNNASQSLN